MGAAAPSSTSAADRTTNSRDGRPYQDKTIEAYVLPAKNLER
jgi:hypothetical protein